VLQEGLLLSELSHFLRVVSYQGEIFGVLSIVLSTEWASCRGVVSGE
jgi:hypothetical protein